MTSTKESTNNIGNYALGKTIGEGTFGKVKLGTHILTGEKVVIKKLNYQVAIKILEKEKIKEQADLERVAREINILKNMRHPNIIQLYEIVETPRSLYLIMEYADGGELFDHIVKTTRIKEKDAAQFLHQILSGIQYIHSQNVTHRDLKPENLLLDLQKQNLKIVDFGLSNNYLPGGTLKTACGSPCYAAPEMIAGKKYFGLHVDIWSCGVVLYAMLCGYLPFEDPVTSNLYKKIISGDYQIPKIISSQAKELIKSILNTDPEKRYTIQQILDHPWMTTNMQQSRINLTPGIQIGKDINMDDEFMDELISYNFNIDYARQCLQNNRHNHLTTTFYLLKLKRQNQHQNHQQPVNVKKLQDEQVLDKKVIQFLTDNNQPQLRLQPSNPQSSQDQESFNDQRNEESPSILTPQPIEICSRPKDQQPLEKEQDLRVNRIATNHSNKTKTRNVSASVEKKPETLFSTAQQIYDKAQIFKQNSITSQATEVFNRQTNQNLSHTKINYNVSRQRSAHETQESYDLKSRSPKVYSTHQQEIIPERLAIKSPGRKTHRSSNIQSPRNTSFNTISVINSRLKSSSPVNNFSTSSKQNTNTQQMKKYKGPFHLNQITTKSPSVLMKVLQDYLNINNFDILKVNKQYELRVEKQSQIFDIQITQLIDAENVYVFKMANIQGSEQTFNNYTQEILFHVNS